MRPETESLEGLGDSLAKAMRCNARVAFCRLLSDPKDRTLGEQPLLARNGRSPSLAASNLANAGGNLGEQLGQAAQAARHDGLNSMMAAIRGKCRRVWPKTFGSGIVVPP